MADNFLEKRMDDYVHGRLNSPRTPRKKSAYFAGFDSPRVFILSNDSEALESVLKTFCDAGAAVMFSIPKTSTGTTLAQRIGGRFIPGKLEGWNASEVAERAISLGDHFDISIGIGCEPIDGKWKIAINAANTSADIYIEGSGQALAQLALFVSLPDARRLRGQTLSTED